MTATTEWYQSDWFYVIGGFALIFIVVAGGSVLLDSRRKTYGTTYRERVAANFKILLHDIVGGIKRLVLGLGQLLLSVIIFGFVGWLLYLGWSEWNKEWICRLKDGGSFHTDGKPTSDWVESTEGVRYPISNIEGCFEY